MSTTGTKVRAAVLLIIAGLAVAVAVAPAKTPASAAFEVGSILREADLNESTADSAPQQQVVNGWVAKDLLAAIARNDSIAASASAQHDRRVRYLLGLLVVAVAWIGLTYRWGRPAEEYGRPSPNPLLPPSPDLPPPTGAPVKATLPPPYIRATSPGAD